MASVKKIDVDAGVLKRLYCDEEKSIPEISSILQISKSTIRLRLVDLGIIRTRGDAVRLGISLKKFGFHGRGKKRTFTEEWKSNISKGHLKRADLTAKGTSKKPSGYIEYTRGVNKFRSVHVVAMEEHIGRRLKPDEVVHHKDENKENNDLNNLQLMTKSEHASHHAKLNYQRRKRNDYGQFE